jgi:predicted aspartyl protease
VTSNRRQIAQGLAAAAGLLGAGGVAVAQTAGPTRVETMRPLRPPPLPASPRDPAAPAEPQVEGGDDPSRVTTGRDSALRMVAPVTLNGEGPFNFLVDTGANRSCISQSLADHLRIEAGAPVSVRTVVGARMRASVVVDRLQLGAKTQRHVTAPVLPMKGIEGDGVLGVDWLKNRRLVLDFNGHGLEITAPLVEAPADNRVVVPARRRSGQLTMVDADVSGRRISAMIDSGSQLSIGNNALREVLPQHSSDKVERIQLATLVGERFSGDLLYLPFLRLGGLTLGNVPVVFCDSQIFALWQLQKTPAVILGMDLLSQFSSVALDFGHSTVRFDFIGKAGQKAL